jgi:hypothetical protein
VRVGGIRRVSEGLGNVRAAWRRPAKLRLDHGEADEGRHIVRANLDGAARTGESAVEPAGILVKARKRGGKSDIPRAGRVAQDSVFGLPEQLSGTAAVAAREEGAGRL